MGSSHDKRNNIRNILDASKPVKPRKKTSEKPVPVGGSSVIIISASGNAQAAGGDIHNHNYPKAPRPPVVKVMPNGDEISEEQRVELTRLKNEWVRLHNAIKKTPKTDAAAWASINRAAGATSYKLIKAKNFDKAVKYIQRQIAMLRNMRSAPTKDKDWRNSRIRSIKARSIRVLGDEYVYLPYIRKNFKAGSLTELSTDQLQLTYAWVNRQKPKIS